MFLVDHPVKYPKEQVCFVVPLCCFYILPLWYPLYICKGKLNQTLTSYRSKALTIKPLYHLPEYPFTVIINQFFRQRFT